MSWTCKVRAAGLTDPPQDCDWPFCGCDPGAERVLEALEDSGYAVLRARTVLKLIDVFESVMTLDCVRVDGGLVALFERAKPIIDDLWRQLTEIDEAAQDVGPKHDDPGGEARAGNEGTPGAGRRPSDE